MIKLEVSKDGVSQSIIGPTEDVVVQMAIGFRTLAESIAKNIGCEPEQVIDSVSEMANALVHKGDVPDEDGIEVEDAINMIKEIMGDD